MTGPDTPPATTPGDETSPEVRRLEARVARERAARLEAERIAEAATAELWEHQQELDAKVARRTAELDAARAAAAAAARDRDAALATISHELRTPLAALLGALDSMVGADLDPDTAALLDRATAAAHELRDTVDTVMGLGRGAEVPVTAQRLLDVHEGDWQEVAARAGKLLIIDLAVDAAAPLPLPLAAYHDLVTAALAGAIEGDRRVIDLRLCGDGPAGLRAEISGV